MMKMLSVPALAACLALSAPAPEARAASGEDIAKIIAGLVVVGAIAAAASQGNRADAADNATSRNLPRRFGYENGRGYYYYRDGRRVPADDGRAARRQDRFTLPEQCLRSFDTNRGRRTVAGEGCLERRGIDTARLPGRCGVRVRTDRGLRDGYFYRCLRQEGYRFVAVRGDRDHHGRVILDARRGDD